MTSPAPAKLPNSVLFVCYLNSIRSPMAEGLMKKRFSQQLYVQSAGMESGDLDELMVAVMAEKSIDKLSPLRRTLPRPQRPCLKAQTRR